MNSEKKERFIRIFPKRVENMVKQLKLLGNCSNKRSFEYDSKLIHRCWIEIAKHLQASAESFGLDMVITIKGKNVVDIDTSKKQTRKRKQL